MKSVRFGTILLVVAVGVLGACGKGSGEAERAFAEACIKFKGNEESTRARCNCQASVIAPRFTAGELKAYVASMELKGKVYTSEDYSKFGVSREDFSSMIDKLGAAWRDVMQTCGEK